MISNKNLRPKKLNFAKTSTISTKERNNLVKIDNLLKPGDEFEDKDFPGLSDIAAKIVAARQKGNPVVWFLGGHVIKCGLSLYLIDLIKNDLITHIAGNGAVSIHDFELAYLGGTSEYVPTAIEDGSFGMWEETGLWMNQAIQEGYEKDMGFGAGLARYMDKNQEKFPYKEYSVTYQSYNHNIPATYHISIGTDIINQHPKVDFAALGGASGLDFKIFCQTISNLEGGVFLNFGSAVTGPEVFLKGLSIARNQGYQVKNIITANFDIISLGNDYRNEISKNDPLYFYRPRKNIINRPTSLGGKGYYIKGNHKFTIPKLHYLISQQMENN